MFLYNSPLSRSSRIETIQDHTLELVSLRKEHVLCGISVENLPTFCTSVMFYFWIENRSTGRVMGLGTADITKASQDIRIPLRFFKGYKVFVSINSKYSLLNKRVQLLHEEHPSALKYIADYVLVQCLNSYFFKSRQCVYRIIDQHLIPSGSEEAEELMKMSLDYC